MAEKTTMVDDAQEKDELVLEDNQLVCALTNKVVKATDKELTLQSMIDMMAEEYGFAPEDMERDFRVTYKEPDSDKCRAQAVDLAIFDAGMAHVVDNLIRFVVVAKDAKVKPTDAKKGVDAMLDNILTFTDCEFGCWTNGEDLHYRYYTEDDFGQSETQDISDFPANGQTLADLEAQGDRAMPRKPANESLIKTFKRCHDYIYGNEGMKKTAFWELLNLIFANSTTRSVVTWMPRKASVTVVVSGWVLRSSLQKKVARLWPTVFEVFLKNLKKAKCSVMCLTVRSRLCFPTVALLLWQQSWQNILSSMPLSM